MRGSSVDDLPHCVRECGLRQPPATYDRLGPSEPDDEMHHGVAVVISLQIFTARHGLARWMRMIDRDDLVARGTHRLVGIQHAAWVREILDRTRHLVN